MQRLTVNGTLLSFSEVLLLSSTSQIWSSQESMSDIMYQSLSINYCPSKQTIFKKPARCGEGSSVSTLGGGGGGGFTLFPPLIHGRKTHPTVFWNVTGHIHSNFQWYPVLCTYHTYQPPRWCNFTCYITQFSKDATANKQYALRLEIITYNNFWNLTISKQFRSSCSTTGPSLRYDVSTGPLAQGNLVWPPGPPVCHSTGPDWPPKIKDPF